MYSIPNKACSQWLAILRLATDEITPVVQLDTCRCGVGKVHVSPTCVGSGPFAEEIERIIFGDFEGEHVFLLTILKVAENDWVAEIVVLRLGSVVEVA